MAMPQLTKHPNGYWHYDFWYDGARYCKSTKTKIKRIAQDVLTDLHNKLVKGECDVASSRPIMKLFTAAYDEYCELMKSKWGGEKGSTYVMHAKSSRKHLVPYFKDFLLKDITTDVLDRYMNHRKAQVIKVVDGIEVFPSNRTINMEIGSLRQMMKHNKLWLRMREKNTEWKLMKENKEKGRAISPAEISRLIDAANKHHSRQILMAIRVSLATGVRSKELRSMQWEDIKLEFNRLAIYRDATKTDAGKRLIPMTPELISLFQAWKLNFPDAQPKHYVFPSERHCSLRGGGHGLYSTNLNKPMTSLKNTWIEIKKAAGVDCRWHDMRHTFGCLIGRRGNASRADIKAIMGHVSDEIMDLYMHSLSEDRDIAVASVMSNLAHLMTDAPVDARVQ